MNIWTDDGGKYHQDNETIRPKREVKKERQAGGWLTTLDRYIIGKRERYLLCSTADSCSPLSVPAIIPVYIII